MLKKTLTCRVDVILHNSHTKKRCTNEKKCAKCGDIYHEHCSNLPRCIKCGANHSALDKECPIWNDEIEIKKIQTENRITMREARRIRRETAPMIPRTYTRETFAKTVIGNSTPKITEKRRLADSRSDENTTNKKANETLNKTLINIPNTGQLNTGNTTTQVQQTKQIGTNPNSPQFSHTEVFLSDTEIQQRQSINIGDIEITP